MPPFDLGLIRVERLIVHEIPRRFASATPPAALDLSEDVSPLDPTVRNFFQERMANALGTAAYEVELDPDTGSPLPAIVRSLCAGPVKRKKFVAYSKEMATHLHSTQQGSNSAGLLTVMSIEVDETPGVAVLKLEKEEGTRVKRTGSGSSRTLSVDHVRDLMLTGRTKVFKVGIFTTVDGSVRGLVCDRQRGAGATVAFFFLERFLGCRLLELPEITTKRFFDATQSFIQGAVTSPETKARYQVALAAELGSTSESISSRGFAATHLDQVDRQPFADHMEAQNVPTTAFAKDNALVEGHLQRIQMSFAHGTMVLADPNSIGDTVEVTDLEDGRTRVEVTDHLKTMRGHR